MSDTKDKGDNIMPFEQEGTIKRPTTPGKNAPEKLPRKAEKDDAELERLINNYFLNPTAPSEDEMGVDVSFVEPHLTRENDSEEEEEVVSVGLDLEVEEVEEEESDALDEEEGEDSLNYADQVEEETEDEEVFLIHPNGDITSEADEAEEVEEKVVYEQSLVDRTIMNMAIRELFEDIKTYESLLEDATDSFIGNGEDDNLSQALNMKDVVNPMVKDGKRYLADLRSELMKTKFSLYATTPKEPIDLDAIEDEALSRAVIDRIEEKIKTYLNLGQ